MNLTGRVAAITGASSGIGAATALALGARGVKLVLGARRQDKLEAVAAQARAQGAEVITLPCDVGRRADVDRMVQAAVERWGRLDVMVANAGFGLLAKVHEMAEADFDEIVQVNVKGTWYAMQAAAAAMLRQRPPGGHIIVMSSAAARRGLPLYGVYSMTKAAQLSMAEAMRIEMHGTGVYVSSVHPVTTATEFFDVASQRSRVRSQGVGKPQTAALVAGKIVRLIERPKPELWPSAPSRVGLGLAALMPRMTDRAMRKMLPRRTERPPTEQGEQVEGQPGARSKAP